jgi:hypothetical protein
LFPLGKRGQHKNLVRVLAAMAVLAVALDLAEMPAQAFQWCGSSCGVPYVDDETPLANDPY